MEVGTHSVKKCTDKVDLPLVTKVDDLQKFRWKALVQRIRMGLKLQFFFCQNSENFDVAT